MSDYRKQARFDAFDKAFPGKSCGNSHCEEMCAEIFFNAIAMHVSPDDAIRKAVHSEFDCLPVSHVYPNCCRFGFIPADSNIDDNTVYTFHAKTGECNICKALDGTVVLKMNFEDDGYMNRAGFFMQKNGTYLPHPNCKCEWEITGNLIKITGQTDSLVTHNDISLTIDYSVYSWDKIHTDKLATYVCADIPVSEEIIHGKIPDSLKKSLANQVQLDALEFDQWAQNIKITNDNGKATISADVPNIWICADLLRGGSWYWDVPVINKGGTIGQIVSFAGTWGMHEIKCETTKELRDAFKDNYKKIWGFVLYAHGSRSGQIKNSEGDDEMPQSDLMNWVRSQGFKLAKADVMQCYSGFKGLTKITYSYKAIRNHWVGDVSGKSPNEILLLARNNCEMAFQRILKQRPFYTLEKCYISSDTIVVELKTDMGNTWKSLAGVSIVYQGINFAAIDWGFLEKDIVEYQISQ